MMFSNIYTNTPAYGPPVAKNCVSRKRSVGILLRRFGICQAGSGAPVVDHPFLLHFGVQSVLNIDVEVEEPEATENSTQLF